MRRRTDGSVSGAAPYDYERGTMTAVMTWPRAATEPEPEHDPSEDDTIFDEDEQYEEGHPESGVPVCPHCGRVRCICPP